VHAAWATVSATASIPREAGECSRYKPRTDRRCRSADAGPGTNVAERRRSCHHVRVPARRAKCDEGHRLLVLVCVRLRTMGRRSETRSACSNRSGGGALRAPARWPQNSATLGGSSNSAACQKLKRCGFLRIDGLGCSCGALKRLCNFKGTFKGLRNASPLRRRFALEGS
jgi:hypothetical protein